MSTYTFVAADKTSVRRDPDGAIIPWDAQANQPLDISGAAGQQWKADGSPIPDPFVPIPPTPRQVIPPRLGRLYTAVDKAAAGAVDSITVGDWNNKATWTVWFNAAATQPQKDTINATIASYDYQAAEAGDAARSAAFMSDGDSIDLLDRLRNLTPAQINSYVDNNITNIAGAQAAFKRIIKVLARIV